MPRSVFLAVVVMAGIGWPASGQERPFRESVSITVDADAAKSLRMIRDQWDNGPDAATLSSLIELCETRGEALVLQDRGVAGGIARFIRLQAAADELIAGLTADVLATYRHRMDSLAEPWWNAWQTTGESRYLDRLVTRAFFSSWGDDAVWAAAQVQWNRGDYAAARRLWQRLLPAGDEPAAEPRYPDATFSPAEITARLILCDIFSGQEDQAQASWTRFAETYPNATGSLGGRTGRWNDLLKDAIQQSKSWRPPVTSEDVATYAGNESRQRIAPTALDIGSELWSVPLPNPRLPAVNRPPVFPQQLPLAFHPVVLDDLVLLNDGRQLHAWNLYSGKPYWDAGHEGGDVVYPLVADPLPMIPGRPVAGQAQWTMTVAHGRVYARMGSAVTTPAATEFRDLPAEMVCLDISQGEGQLLWKQSAEELVPTVGDLPVWRWEGSPVVESGRVYAVMSRRRPQLEWSLVCLDAESGLLLWHRSIGITRPTPPDQENRASNLLLTTGGGQLYLATGWGAVVAVDPRDGQVNWAVTYESNIGLNGTTGAIPVIYDAARLYAALLDGDRLACLDAPSGRLLWSRPLIEPLRDLLGVVQDRVIVSGRSLWGFEATSGNLMWSVPSTDPDDWGYGRGALAGDQILWSNSQALWFIDQRTGALLREHPLRDADATRSGGNVVVSHGVILIAGADRLTAYGEFARLREPLQRPLTDRRRDLQRELKLAEIAFAVGEPRQAEALWDHVLKQPEPAVQVETRRARARISLLPGRRTTRNPERAAPTVPVTAVATQSKSTRPTSPTVPSTGFWKRSWRKPLVLPSQALLPCTLDDDIPSSVVVDGTTLALWNAATGAETVLAHGGIRVEWCGQWLERMVFVTDEEILLWDRAQHAFIQRLPRPAETKPDSSSTRWIVHPRGLLVLAPPRSVALLDVVTGDWRWNRVSERGGWQAEIGWNEHRLAIHPPGQGGVEIWEMATGTTLRRDHPPTGPWKIAPQFWGLGDDYITVMEDDRLVGHSVVPARRWEFVGVVSSAHTAPWVMTTDEDCFAVIDGQRIVAIQRDSGWPRWSTTIASPPLQSRQQMALWNRHLFAASSDSLRAVNLETGGLLWKTALPSSYAGSRRCVMLAADSDHPTLAVIPMTPGSGDESVAPIGNVELYSATTGQRIQSLRLTRPSKTLAVASCRSHQAVLATEHEVLGIHRP